MEAPKFTKLITQQTNTLLTDIGRARELFTILVTNGATKDGASYRPLMQVDKRDITQFLFFEVAASWEHFARETFIILVRQKYFASPQKAVFLVGSPDRGLNNIMGWGSPKQLKDRATNFFGKNSILTTFAPSSTNQQVYQRLEWAHQIRNRIAHSGTSDKYQTILSNIGIPTNQRKGVGPGRLLLEYPSPAHNGDRWFDRLLSNYEIVAKYWQSRLI